MQTCKSNLLRQRGFTMIELLITVTILVILASVALPSYRSFVAKSVRTQAKSALMLVADRQEQYFMDNKQYTNDLSLLGFTANPLVLDRDGFEVPAESDDAVYQVALAAFTPTSYTLSATPLGAQADADPGCGTLSLTDSGQRASSGPAADCW